MLLAMSSPACLTQDVSVCLRCQNRIASRRQFRRRPMSCAVSLRSMTSTRYLSQEQTQHEYPASNSDTPTIFSQFVYQNRLPYSKHTGLLSQSSEKIEVLGRSAEILLLPNTGRLKTVKKSNTSQSEESSEVGVKLGYSEMLEAMNEERGVVSPARVAKNIESIKTSWLSRLHNRAGVPSLSEYERIARDLSEGFTFLQLQRYLKLPSIGIPASAMELAEPYSTDLYTRSSWRPEFTPFPGNVSSQLLSLRGIINDGDDTKPRGPNINIVKRNESGRSAKSFIIDKILRDRWKFKTNKEKEIKGELDIWIQQDSLNLILNHSKVIRVSLLVPITNVHRK